MTHALRLRPGDELMSSLKAFCRERDLDAAYVATCVGSLARCELRLANADRDRRNEVREWRERFEILSLVGTVSRDGAHLHAAIADANGTCVGGHLISGDVFTTAEVVLGVVPATTFRRVYDDATGFDELEVGRAEDARDADATRRERLLCGAGVALLALGVLIGRRRP